MIYEDRLMVSRVVKNKNARESLLKALKPTGFMFSIRLTEIRNIYMLSIADAQSVTGSNPTRFFETEDFTLIFAMPIGNLVDTLIPVLDTVAAENFAESSIQGVIDSSSLPLRNRLIIVTLSGLLISVEFRKKIRMRCGRVNLIGRAAFLEMGKVMASKKFKGFGGITLNADVFGPEEAPSVLMLHGGGQSRNSWTSTAKNLSQAGRHVIALDWRGHGESEWSSDGRYDLDAFVGDLHEILRQLSSRPVIMGASLGGWIATIALGESETELAAGLILVDAPAEIDLEHIMLVGDELRAHSNEDTGRGPFDPKFINGLDLEAVQRRVTQAAANLNHPTLLVRGANSKVSNAESIAILAGLIQDSEAIEIEDSGHLIAVDQADTFNALLVDFLERRSPRDAPEFIAGSDPHTLRNALGCFATGITVVTTSGADGVNVGMTANSFTSVSLDPPLLLVCLGKNLSCLPIFEASNSFAVNVLHIGQQQVSNLFASKIEDRFSQIEWDVWDQNVPIIGNALANFECKKYAEYDGGDHIILVGQVVRVKFEPRRDPLLYFRGKYRRLHFV